MDKIQILTVIYHESHEAFSLFKKFVKSCKDAQITAVVNKKLDGVEYPQNIIYIDNDENCLSKAWNIGLKKLFKEHKFVFVSGNDSLSPSDSDLKQMVKVLKQNPHYGVLSANHTQDPLVYKYLTKAPFSKNYELENVSHGDGSFSFFLISKECYEDVGNFDENFKPAYFEDNDYLERLWLKGYAPKMLIDIIYYHLVQGSVKLNKTTASKYPEFMNKNLKYFREKWNKTPEHLPNDIKF